MFCKNCGNNISDEAVFCTNCGAQVGDNKTPLPDAQANKANVQPSDAKPSNAVGLVGFILAMVSALFWLIGIFAASIMFIISIALGIAAVVCSAIGMSNASKNNAQFRGLSIAGLVVSIVVVAISLILLIVGLAAMSVMF